MVEMIKVGIIGGAGYTGGEMLRLLLLHPVVEISFVHSRSHAGAPVTRVHRDLFGETDLQFTGEVREDIDVLFLCVGHGEARPFLEAHPFPGQVRVIDLSQDFRLAEHAVLGDRVFTYGLPECNIDAIRTAGNIANPGCFATALQLALLPLTVGEGLTGDMHVTGITGSTGAGQKLRDSSHFSWRANNIQAYKSLSHQHVPEVMQTLRRLKPECGAVYFVPWRGDFPRGIHVTAYTRSDLSLEAAYELYEHYYSTQVFTHVNREMIDLKQVVNTNKCLIHLERAGDSLVVHAVIDNLLKGASGQAVQNMNLMLGLPEDTGLKLKSIVF